MNWEEALTQTMRHRILDDEAYARRRLGRVPTEAEVDAASEEVVRVLVDRVGEFLDPFEEDVWDALIFREGLVS